MSKLILSRKAEVVCVKKKSQAKVFKDLKVGDIVEFSLGLDYQHGTHNITIKNIKTGECSFRTVREMQSILALFTFKPVECDC